MARRSDCPRIPRPKGPAKVHARQRRGIGRAWRVLFGVDRSSSPGKEVGALSPKQGRPRNNRYPFTLEIWRLCEPKMRQVIAVTDMGILWEDYWSCKDRQEVGVLKSLSHKALTVIVIGFAASAATRIYYLREMLAALILFAVLFSGVAALLLLLFVLYRTGEATLEFLESRAREALHHARSWSTYSEPQSRA